MDKRKLGNLEVSKIGMGCMGFSHGYGDIPKEEYAIEAIRDAYDYGCTFFDTAEGYGALLYGAGHNERLLGKAVYPFRDNVVLASKFHFRGDSPKGQDEVDAYIREHLRQTLINLNTDHLDLYYLHRVNKEVPVEMVALTMGKLIEEGLIGGWGLSQAGVDTIEKAHKVTSLSAVQNLYNMMERDAEDEVIPFCLEHGIGVVPFSPVASGFLSGKLNSKTDFSHVDDVRKFVPQLKKENIEKNAPILELIERIANQKGATKAQVSIAWMMEKYPNVVPIPGSKNKTRIMENLKASEIRFSKQEILKIDEALDAIEVYGHRGQEEYDGMSMSEWGKGKQNPSN